MSYLRIGRCGLLPRPNRPMVIFNGVPYRHYRIETQARLDELGGDRPDPVSIAGEFGVAYHDRVEWVCARHIWSEWSLRPSGRPVVTLWGVKYARRSILTRG